MTAGYTGRCWRFGDNINTDLMWPAEAFRATNEERLQLVFSANRPGWYRTVRQGDILVAGSNFGTGSGRPAASLLRQLGIAAIVASSVNGLFLRNAINSGLVAMECEVPPTVEEGATIAVDPAHGTVTIEDGTVLRGTPLPPELLELAEAGGVLPRLRAEGYVA